MGTQRLNKKYCCEDQSLLCWYKN